MGPPSSGGTTVLEALNIMQDFSRRGVAFKGRAGTLYNYLEASRLAYADRNAYLGDPSFVTQPDRGPALERVRRHARRADRPDRRPRPGRRAARRPASPAPPGSAASVDRVGSTTHLSVADKDGNIVAYTFTIE